MYSAVLTRGFRNVGAPNAPGACPEESPLQGPESQRKRLGDPVSLFRFLRVLQTFPQRAVSQNAFWEMILRDVLDYWRERSHSRPVYWRFS